MDFAARFRDPFLRSAFESFAEAAFESGSSMIGLVVGMTQTHKRNGGLPEGGALPFAKAIERRYLDLGGDVQYRARVDRIQIARK